MYAKHGNTGQAASKEEAKENVLEASTYVYRSIHSHPYLKKVANWRSIEIEFQQALLLGVSKLALNLSSRSVEFKHKEWYITTRFKLSKSIEALTICARYS